MLFYNQYFLPTFKFQWLIKGVALFLINMPILPHIDAILKLQAALSLFNFP